MCASPNQLGSRIKAEQIRRNSASGSGPVLISGGAAMYQLDLETILQLLFRHSGELIADLPPTPGTLISHQARARIRLVNGKVAGCSIFSGDRLLLAGEAAREVLRQQGILAWSFTPGGVPESVPLAAPLLRSHQHHHTQGPSLCLIWSPDVAAPFHPASTRPGPYCIVTSIPLSMAGARYKRSLLVSSNQRAPY